MRVYLFRKIHRRRRPTHTAQSTRSIRLQSCAGVAVTPTTRPHKHAPTHPHNHTPTQPHTHTPTQPRNHTTTQPLLHQHARMHAHVSTRSQWWTADRWLAVTYHDQREGVRRHNRSGRSVCQCICQRAQRKVGHDSVQCPGRQAHRRLNTGVHPCGKTKKTPHENA